VTAKLTFVIAGTQKGGTTTLDALMRRHPQVQMARTKETHFFDNDMLDWTAPDYSLLHGHYIDDDRMRGEATPITMYWKPAIQRLVAYQPDIRLILLLRDPVERAYSGWNMSFQYDREHLPFAEAIRTGRARVASNAESARRHSYVERSQYGAQLDHLLKVFPRDRIHIEITEEFLADQAAGLARVTAFLGIDTFVSDIVPVHMNPARAQKPAIAMTEDDAAYLARIFTPDIKAVESLTGRRLDHWRRWQ